MIELSRRKLLQFTAGGLAVTVSPAMAAAAASVNESGFQKIGGIDQWIALKGQDDRNPAILYLHGGPGEALSPFLSQFNPWEHDFTVAYWDQRGAGKTYSRNGASTPGMTLERLVDDAVEIAKLVKHRLSKKKLILVGQSWGSVLGVHVIKRHPDSFYAFIGAGLPVSLRAASEDRARQPVLSPPDLKFKDEVLGGYADPNSTKGEEVEWRAGAAFSGSTIGQSMEDFDLRKLGLDMPIPFFVIQGREDHIAGFKSVKAYVEDVRAPKKAFVPIDGGHYACFTNADPFVAALRKYGSPLAR